MVNDAVHPNGYLGYVQGTGKEPKDGQPVAYDSKPDFDDYGTGCFLRPEPKSTNSNKPPLIASIASGVSPPAR